MELVKGLTGACNEFVEEFSLECLEVFKLIFILSLKHFKDIKDIKRSSKEFL